MNEALQLADEYIRFTDRHVFLTGKAGTGKTTFLKKLRETCPKRMVVVAPTGIAAINAGGVTLHSFFGLPFGPFVPGSDSYSRSGYHRLSREKKKIVKSLDLLIIDEISMVRADMLDAVDSVLRRHRRSNAPFGGVQLLMVGDLQQLAPVVTNKEQPILAKYYDTPYFFSSNALKSTELIGIELEKIYRQTDTGFINLLNCIRENRDTAGALEQLNQRFVPEPASDNYPGYITLCTHNRLAEVINASRMAELDSAPSYFPAEIEGEFPDKSYPAAENLELKIGSQVMFIRNDPSQEKRYFNGKIGKVTRIAGDEIDVLCEGEDSPITVEPSKWENIEYSLDEERGEIVDKVIGSFSQYPLRLAWAITIHKSQGLTFDRVIIDAQAAFSHGQVYVALSRCRTLDGIVLRSQLNDRAIKGDPKVLRFSEEVRSNQENHRAVLEQEKRFYQQRLLLECFDFQQLDRYLSRFLSLVTRYRDQVQVFGGELLGGMQDNIRRDICVVGQNFGRQLQGLFGHELLPGDDPVILDRIIKAAAYFGDKLKTVLADPFEQVHVETDNKEIRKQVNRALDALKEEEAVKIAAVDSCREGFAPDIYLRAVSGAAVDYASTPRGAGKKTEVTYTEADVAHPDLFRQLKEWRTEKAKELGVPAFHVLHQKTLVQVAVHLPDSAKALQQVKGIGPVTAERYGAELVSMVQEYRRENGITTVTLPVLSQEKLVKQEAQSKKNTKEISLELFEQGKSVQEIAKEREMTVQTIEKHMAHWVAEGKTAIEKLVAEDRRLAIEQAFQEVGITPLKKVKDFLGADFTYGELTLVRAYLQSREVNP